MRFLSSVVPGTVGSASVRAVSPSFLSWVAPGLLSLSGMTPGFPGSAPGFISISGLFSLGTAYTFLVK